VSSKIGRPLGRPRSRSSILGHPGASPEKGEPVFSTSPAPRSGSKVAEGKARDLETRTILGSSAVAIVDPGASWCVAGEGRSPFSSSPRSPLLHNAAQERWPIDADAPWKSYGRLRGTARTEPPTALSTEFGKPANGCRFSTSVNRPAALRREVSPRSFFHYERNIRTRRKQEPGNTIDPSTRSGQVQTLGSRSGVHHS